jgi:hypothetical protein
MRIDLNKLEGLTVDDLQAAIRGLVWALDGSESNEDKEVVTEILWLLESELLNRGLLPAVNVK